jgi:ABC-2 type transport system ATP-binding protein
MEEAGQLSNRVAIIDGGKVIALDTPAELKRSIQQQDVLQLEVERFDPSILPEQRDHRHALSPLGP